jgi:amino acid transporter
MRAEASTTLARRLGLGLVTLYGLGNIIGAGIYVLVGEVAGLAGMASPLAFLIAAAAAAFTALTYGEICARFPVSAGEAVYVQEAFSRRALSLAVGLLVALAGIVSAATLVRGFVGYLQVLVPLPALVALLATPLVLGAVAAWGIAESMWTAAVLTLFEVVGLVLVVGVAAPDPGVMASRLTEIAPQASLETWQGIALAAFLAFYAFLGFEDMVNVAEEVRAPERTMPLAILIALGVATALYGVVVLVAVLAVPPEALAASDAPLALVYETATGRRPVLIAWIGGLAVMNGALVQMIMGARMLYGMSRRHWLPESLGRVHPRTRTPLRATALVTGLVLALALWVPLVGLAGATSTLVLVVFSLVNAALIRLKRRTPAPAGVRPWPAWVPWAGLLSTSGLLAAQGIAAL